MQEMLKEKAFYDVIVYVASLNDYAVTGTVSALVCLWPLSLVCLSSCCRGLGLELGFLGLSKIFRVRD